jgi:bleomycin hydrolase
MKNSSVKTGIIFTLVTIFILNASIIAGDGGLSMGTIEEIRNDFSMDPHTRAMYNAITNTGVKEMALNREILLGHNEVFSHKIKARGITHQKSSGRCWLFAGLNILRPAVMEKYKLNKFEFSQNYLAFWDKMEKANCFLETIIEFADKDPLDREMTILLRGPYGDGGWWRYVVNLIDKYGVVPKEVMPETNSSGSTGMMNRVISKTLRIDAVKLRKMHAEGKTKEELRAEKETMLAEIYRMLVVNLGEPPTEFPYRFEDRDSVVSEMKTYTPQKFYIDFVGVDLHEYISIFNDPTKEYGHLYSIDLSRNMYDRDNIIFANTAIEVLKDAAMQSVLDDEPVWFACDVGKDQSKDHGIMAMDIYDYGPIYNIDLGMTKAERVMYRQSAPNHAMVFVGVDVKEEIPVKWWVENSWGSSAGSGGYWTMYDTWFDNHVYNVIVKKEYVPKEVLAIFDQTPTVLPPWDPMYEMFK